MLEFFFSLMLIGGDFELILKIFNNLVLGVKMWMFLLFWFIINMFLEMLILSLYGYLSFVWEYECNFFLELFMIVILCVL